MNSIGKNIAKFRKEKNLTQEDLARYLDISFQAVSKWETGQALPDILTLKKLAAFFDISMDSLAGYQFTKTPYEEWYKTDEYYWGIKPSSLCLKILELLPPEKPYSVLDIGCGEGKDAVFLAKCGYRVSAFDIANSGIEKGKRLMESSNTFVDFFVCDINEYRLDKKYDILFSSGVLHYIKPELKKEIFRNYKENTEIGGINAMNVFVDKPFIAPPPEKEESCLWKSGEIFTLYSDWLFEEFSEKIFDCNSSGIPHKHAMDVMIAKKL